MNDFLQNFYYTMAKDDASKLVLRPIADLVARLSWVNESLECGSDIVAEDAAEAAFAGDGPCGSAQRAQDYKALEREARALHYAIREAGDVGPKLPAELIVEDCPF